MDYTSEIDMAGGFLDDCSTDVGLLAANNYRSSLLRDIQVEDQHRQWYYEQLQALTLNLETLQRTANYDIRADLSKRQLEYEAHRLRQHMAEHLGSSQQIAARHEARLQRIRLIESEMIRMQHKHQQQAVLNGTVKDAELSATETSLNLAEPCNAKLCTIGTQTFEDGRVEMVLHPQLKEELGPRMMQPAVPQVPSSQSNPNLYALYHGDWPIDKAAQVPGPRSLSAIINQETASVMSFNSTNTHSSNTHHISNQQLGTKVEMVYSLLSMLGTHDKDDMSRTLLAMSSSLDSCIAMRQSGCLPLLIQLLHGSDKDSVLGNTRGHKAARARAAAALHNIVHSHPDDKRGRREARVLRLLEQIRAHCDQLRDASDDEGDGEKASHITSADIDHHPGPAIAALMKLSFDEEHRHAICTLGGLQAIAELLQLDHEVNKNTSEQYNITMRRYACMALTNLTFGDGTNKALLCSMKSCMRALVAQLQSCNEDLRQVAASVLRNLSWRADLASKKTLREVGAVTSLMMSSMEVRKESTLKSILSALWNLSAHCSENKADICGVDGALAFLVSSLTYKSPSKTLAIIENGGGILRNISSHIAVREDYRRILREHDCLHILLKHLRSPSLTVVSNACGTLWNLSARCPEDQRALWEMGAVNMLRNLVHSKHKMISMGSAAALKNLLAAKPALPNLDSHMQNKSNMPKLHVRKQRALEAEIDQSLSETCENVESPHDSPTNHCKHVIKDQGKYFNNDTCNVYQVADVEHRRSMIRGPQLPRHSSVDSQQFLEGKLRSPSRPVSRSASQDSVGSVHSDISHDRIRGHSVLAKSTRLLQERHIANLERQPESLPQQVFRKPESGCHSDTDDVQEGANSRIMQVMQEVILHAGMDSPNYIKDPYHSFLHESQVSDNASRHAQQNAVHAHQQQQPVHHTPRIQNFMKNKQDPRNPVVSVSNSSALPDNCFSNLSQCMENLQLNVEDVGGGLEDEPINYSLKYTDSVQSSQPPPAVSTQYSPITQTALIYDKTKNVCNVVSPKGGNVDCVGYAETDLDEEDQPTNFSARYAEQVDDTLGNTDQPINYSTRYQEPEANCADCNLGEVRRASDVLDSEDCVRTFCTEDTPLNFLSTATSMNDLTSKNIPDPCCPTGIRVEKAYSDCTSSAQNTGSTVISHTRNESNVINLQSGISAEKNEQHMLYVYDDHSAAGSPHEKPRAYCTEDTPVCLTRSSSLSELTCDDLDSKSPQNVAEVDDSEHQHELGTQTRNTNKSVKLREGTGDHEHDSSHNLDTSGGFNHSFNQSANTSHGKSVTFDDNNQVQETPMMFSRCSSLGSLSSFDAHSVHSSVVSEYSRRASEVVSPSELPDSPSDSMPGSPAPEQTVLKFELDDTQDTEINITQIENVNARPAEKNATQNNMGDPSQNQPETVVVLEEPSQDTTQNFAEKDIDSFSCATSLSALTFDDEPVIEKSPDLRRVMPIGQERTPDSRASKKERTFIEGDADKAISGEDDDSSSSVSEGEEDMLAECISLAMPTNSSRRKMRRSTSDSFLKKKSMQSHHGDRNKSNLPVISQSSQHWKPEMKMAVSYHGSLQPDDFPTGYPASDTPKMFATEGTPLNHSNAGSLSDLSMLSDEADVQKANETKENMSRTLQRNDSITEDRSDVSSLGEEGEDLLSSVIEAAMPKTASRKHSGMDRRRDGGSSSNKRTYPSYQQHQFARQHAYQSEPVVQSNSTLPLADTLSIAHQQLPADSVTTYAVEDTPLNFSRAESLSDISDIGDIESQDNIGKQLPGSHLLHNEAENQDMRYQPSEGGSQDMRYQPTEGRSQDMRYQPTEGGSQGHTDAENPVHRYGELDPPDDSFSFDAPLVFGIEDSPRVFGVEGTPLSFSRNDSLSSLSCDEDNDLQNDPDVLQRRQQSPHQSAGVSSAGRGSGHMTPRQHILHRKGFVSPGSTHRNKIPVKAQRCLNYEKLPESPLAESPNQADKPAGFQAEAGADDHVLSYAIEGTPACFSRNSSLSSLNSSHEALANHSGSSDGAAVEEMPAPEPPEKQPFLAEDASLNYSHNSSLSSLSMESLGFDPTPSESALLEECINAAMPKSTKPSKKKSRIAKNSPNSASTPKDKLSRRSLPDSMNFSTDKNSQNHFLMNEMTPIHNADERQGFSWQRSRSQPDRDGMLKQQKEFSNQEKVDAMDLINRSQNGHERDLPDVSQLAKDLKTKLHIDSFAHQAPDADNRPLQLEIDNKLVDIELEDSDMIASAIFREASEIAGELEKAESCSESDYPIVAKEDIEPTKEHIFKAVAYDLGCRSLEGNLDITTETLPDVALSLLSSTTSYPGDIPPPVQAATAEPSCNDSLDTTDRTMIDDGTASNSTGDTSDTTINDKQVDTDGDTATDLSAEELSALEENAALIVTELSFNRDLLTSTIDDEQFIDNETISLVSNDYTSDTASEVSVTLSCSSKTFSENSSEVGTDGQEGSKSCARVVKPGEKKPSAKEIEDVKAVRGKRRSVNSFRPNMGPPRPPVIAAAKVGPPAKVGNASKPPPKTMTPLAKGATKPPTTPKITPAKPAQVKQPTGSAVKPAVKAVVNKTSKVGAAKPLMSKQVTGKPAPANQGNAKSTSSHNTSLAGQTTGSKGSSETGKNQKVSAAQTTKAQPATGKTGSGPGNRSTLAPGKRPASASKVKTNAKSKKQNDETSDRPKPPIKQGTFTKESPTLNASEIVNVDDIASSPDTNPLKISPGSNTSSNRSSAELKYSNDTQEKPHSSNQSLNYSSQENLTSDEPIKSGAITPSRINPSKKRNSVPQAGRSSSTGNLHRMSVRPAINKTSSGTVLNKTDSGSNTSLNKSGSNTSLNRATFKLPGKPAPIVKKSESQTSFKKTPGRQSFGSAPTTPRKSSLGNVNVTSTTTTSTPQPSTGGKRYVASKIASLWKKEDNASESKGMKMPSKLKATGKSNAASAGKGSPKMSPRLSRASLLPKSAGSPRKSSPSKKHATGAGESKSTPPPEGLKRSSTYDKLPFEMNSPEMESTEGTSQGDDANPQTQKTMWRRTYTISTEDELVLQVADISLGKENTEGSHKVITLAPAEKQPLNESGDADTPGKSLGEDIKSPHRSQIPGPTSKVSPNKRIPVRRELASTCSPVKTVAARSALVANENIISNESGSEGTPPLSPDRHGQPPPPLSSDVKSCSVSPSKLTSPPATNAAIVAPFNYNPNQQVQKTSSNNIQADVCLKNTANTTALLKSSLPTSPSKTPQTKTEMLIARRRQSYLNSLNKLDDSNDDESKPCLVTTV